MGAANFVTRLGVALLLLGSWFLHIEATSSSKVKYKNAYATMMYMGTPRDYEFYVAVRVLLKSLSALHVQADLLVIASVDVPLPWIQALWVAHYLWLLSDLLIVVPSFNCSFSQFSTTTLFFFSVFYYYKFIIIKSIYILKGYAKILQLHIFWRTRTIHFVSQIIYLSPNGRPELPLFHLPS